MPTQHRTGVPASFVVHPAEEFVISRLSCVAALYPQRQLWVFIVFIESQSCDSNKLFCHNDWIIRLAEFSQEKSLKCWKSSSDISSVYKSNVNYTKVSSRKVKRRKISSAGIWEELLGFGNIFLLDFYLVIWNKGIFYKNVNVCSIFNLPFLFDVCQYFLKSFFLTTLFYLTCWEIVDGQLLKKWVEVGKNKKWGIPKYIILNFNKCIFIPQFFWL